MPKLSGFEMLETLRAAPEMNDVKVIMMTALGQAEDRARGEKLGVIKYLVKSQVTLEDFIRTVREVMPPGQASADGADAPKTQENSINNNQESEQNMQDDHTNPSLTPSDDQSAGANPVSGGDPSVSPGQDSAAAPAGDQMSTSQEQSVVDSQVNDFAASAPSEPTATTPAVDVSPLGDSSTAPAAPASDVPQTPAPAPEEPKPEDGSATPPPAAGL